MPWIKNNVKFQAAGAYFVFKLPFSTCPPFFNFYWRFPLIYQCVGEVLSRFIVLYFTNYALRYFIFVVFISKLIL